MRFFNQQHAFYCGVDLHARTMYLVILDSSTFLRRAVWCRTVSATGRKKRSRPRTSAIQAARISVHCRKNSVWQRLPGGNSCGCC